MQTLYFDVCDNVQLLRCERNVFRRVLFLFVRLGIVWWHSDVTYHVILYMVFCCIALEKPQET